MKLSETGRRTISFPDKYAAFRHAVSLFRYLPGLRGLWTMTDFDINGNAEDMTKYDLLLTRNGNPLYTYTRLIPHLYFDGVGDYLTRADEAALDITGSEAHIGVSTRGLTTGTWFYSSDVTNFQRLIDKRSAAAGNYSYYLADAANFAGDPARFLISDDGTNTDAVNSSNSIAANTWHFSVGRFNDNDTGEELAVFLDGVKTTAATARAAIFAGTADLGVGGSGAGADLLTGGMSITFLCAMALPDDMIGALFQQSRALYGV